MPRRKSVTRLKSVKSSSPISQSPNAFTNRPFSIRGAGVSDRIALNGVEFSFDSEWPTKETAAAMANAQRRMGKRARVIPRYSVLGSSYLVYLAAKKGRKPPLQMPMADNEARHWVNPHWSVEYLEWRKDRKWKLHSKYPTEEDAEKVGRIMNGAFYSHEVRPCIDGQWALYLSRSKEETAEHHSEYEMRRSGRRVRS